MIPVVWRKGAESTKGMDSQRWFSLRLCRRDDEEEVVELSADASRPGPVERTLLKPRSDFRDKAGEGQTGISD